MVQNTSSNWFGRFVVIAILGWGAPACSEEAVSVPWLRMRISQAACTELFTRTRVYDAPIQQDILGAWVSGVGTNRVRVSPRLQPRPGAFCFSLDFEAEVVANTVSRKRAATICSLSTTNMIGGKVIDFDGQNIRLHPASVRGSTASQLTGFSWARPIGKELAWNQALTSKPAAERESARKACLRAERALDDQVDQLIDRMLGELKQRRDLATVLGGCECSVRLHTSENEIVWSVYPKSMDTLDVAPVEHSEFTHDVELIVDERLLEEVALKALGARTFGEETWHKLGQLLPQGASSSLQIRDPEQIWTVEFAKQPLDIDFKDGQIHATLHIASLSRGKQTLPPMDLKVVYEVVPSVANGQLPLLRRIGRPNAILVEQPQTLRLGLRQQIYRSMVRERVTPLLPEEIPLGGSSTMGSDVSARKLDVQVSQGRLRLFGDLQ